MLITVKLKEYWEALLNFALPYNCVICLNALVTYEKEVCLTCLYELPKLDPEFDQKELQMVLAGRCPEIEIGAVFVFGKGSAIRKLIHLMKYRRAKEVGLFLGEQMGLYLECCDFSEIDVLVPVPLHPKKEKQRGYNQSLLLAQGIQRLTKLPIEKNVLIRKEHHESQTAKSKLERWENVKDLFEIQNGALLKGKRVLLIDDVMTTGSTIEACYWKLMKSGTINVAVFVLAFPLKK